MGCGSSTHGGAIRVRIDSALASHLSAALAIDPESLEIKQYVSLLRSDGCDTAADFDDMTIDDLKGEPFCFKRQHLKKIARSRGKAEPRRSSEAERLPNITPVQTADYETASAGSKATRSRKPAVPVTAASLPAGPRTKSLLPTGKHAFLSYQWDVQEQVKEIKGMLNERQIKCKDANFFCVFGRKPRGRDGPDQCSLPREAAICCQHCYYPMYADVHTFNDVTQAKVGWI